MLSDYAVSLLDPDRPWKPSKKLVPNLLNKKKNVAHYRNLQLYTKYGLIITKIHAKLQANATFGTTMEQVRNRVNVRLIADPNKLIKAVTKRESEIINQDLVMVRGARAKITLNKPIAVGFSILEISKFIMYSKGEICR